MTKPKIETLSDRRSGRSTGWERAEIRFWNRTWRIIATAKLVTSMVAPEAFRTGRKATRSIATARIIAQPMARRAERAKGNSANPQNINT